MSFMSWWEGGDWPMWPTAFAGLGGLAALAVAIKQREPQGSRLFVLVLGLAAASAGLGVMGYFLEISRCDVAIANVNPVDRDVIRLYGELEARAPLMLGLASGLLVGIPAWMGLMWRRFPRTHPIARGT